MNKAQMSQSIMELAGAALLLIGASVVCAIFIAAIETEAAYVSLAQWTLPTLGP